MNYAGKRLKLIQQGKGLFTDDEPVYIVNSDYVSPNNKFFL
jgi:hypothetical protein